MRYAAIVAKEGKFTTAEFPDCPGCQTFVEGTKGIEAQAAEALQGWLEANLVGRRPPPHPKATAPRGRKSIWVEVPPRLALRISLVWARVQANLTQAQLAKRSGVSQQQIAKVENPDSNPTMETLEKVAKALGARLHVELELSPSPS
jgi:DNA-binding XRE family transcriptional regulator/predicted RNase H-like HicB family nuclease